MSAAVSLGTPIAAAELDSAADAFQVLKLLPSCSSSARFAVTLLMSRIAPLADQDLPVASRAILARHVAGQGTVTNMKRTLARSPLALGILLQWYPLRDAVVAMLGERTTLLFAHAISAQTDCLVCSTFFRRLLIDGGQDPDQLSLDAWQQDVVEFGSQLARDANGVDDRLFAALSQRLAPDQLVTLTVFAGMMIATNVFNNAVRVDLDEYLWPYRKAES
jgi:hypothetical protein